MKHITFSVIFFLLLRYPLIAQEQLAWMIDNYAGVNGIDLQPACIVDSRLKFDMNLLHFNYSLQNNYIGLKRWFIGDVISDNYDDRGDFQRTYLYEKVNSYNKHAYIHFQSSLPILNFMVTVNQKNAFALTTKTRFMTNIDNLEPELAKLAWEALDYPPLWKQTFKNENLNINAMSWGEIGLTYGREIINIKDHYVKGALRAKYLMGLIAAHMYSSNLEYNFTNDDTLSIYNTDVSYGMATNLSDDIYEDFSFSIPGKPTFGFDLGFVYEWRYKAAEKYQYEMDGRTDNWRRDKNKYKVKAGFSVLDMGRVRFDKSTATGNFFADIRNWDISNFDIDGIDAFNDTINTRFVRKAEEGTFKMRLPTTLSYQIDWNIWRPFYLNHTGFIAMNRFDKEARLRNITTYSVGLRIEHKSIGISVPYLYQPGFQNHAIGAALRLGPFVFGTNNLLNFKGHDVIYGSDFYFALKIPVLFKKPKDKDGDKVSDRNDNCRRDPGPWENRGCPVTQVAPKEPEPPADRDKDGVPDVADECIDVPGPKENNGCPYGDKDGDGVLDNADRCIDVPGPIENNGCPYGDKDGDGVLDNADRCIDVPGPIENNGCPYGDKDGDGVLDINDECIDVPGPRENRGCPWSDRDRDGIYDKDDKCPDAPGPAENDGCPWLDTDGDGVLDKDDECPRTPGPADNKGCPKIEKKEQEILDRAFDNLEFETGKSIIRPSSYPDLNNLAELLINKPEAKLRISGHTDNVGSEQMNMTLSKNRAMAVKNYLVSKGVAPSRLVVEWFGPTRPIADNSTPEGRARNRRVEMKLFYD